MKKILVLSGVQKTTEAFASLEHVTTASFKKLWYITTDHGIDCFIDDTPLQAFDAVYFRVVGAYREHAAVIARFCNQHNIRVVDELFTKTNIHLAPINKGIETMLHVEHNIPIPKTAFATPYNLAAVAKKHFTFPCVIKDSEGVQGRNAFSPRSEAELHDVLNKIKKLPHWQHKRFIIQEFIKASHRERIFVIGDTAVAGILTPMLWRKRFTKKDSAQHQGITKAIPSIEKEKADLAVAAAKSAMLDIAGIDLIQDDETKQCYIMEANAEPQWKMISELNAMHIEEKIINYIKKLCN